MITEEMLNNEQDMRKEYGNNEPEMNHEPGKSRAMSIADIMKEITDFRDARNWRQFHNPKDLAISLSLEAAELLEVFQWSGADLEVPEKRDKIEEELADVMMYCALMADVMDLDISEIITDKLAVNNQKYPVEKAYGRADKYTELAKEE